MTILIDKNKKVLVLIFIMNSNIIKDVLEYSHNNLEEFIESQRFIYSDIKYKVENFQKKKD